jgi:hypothetical protein
LILFLFSFSETGLRFCTFDGFLTYFVKMQFYLFVFVVSLLFTCSVHLVVFSTDRRSVFVNLRTHIPERLLQLNGETRLVLATNSYNKLKVYLYFSKPVLNSSAEILNCLQTSQGMLLPVSGETIGNRRFGFLVSWFIQSSSSSSTNFFFFFFFFSAMRIEFGSYI